MPRGPGVEQEREEAPAVDQRNAPARAALAVKRRGGEPVRDGSVVGQPQLRCRYLLALAIGEERAATLDRVRGQHRADEPEEARGDEGVENDRAAPARHLAGARERRRALRRLAADRLRVDRVRATPETEPQARHQVGPLAGERRGVRPNDAGLERTREPARAGERAPPVDVRVDDLLHLRDLRMSARRTLRGERDLDLALGAPPGDLRRAQSSHLRQAGLLRQALVGIRVGHLSRAVRGAGDRSYPLLSEIGAVGVPRAAVEERPYPHPSARGVGEALHVPVVDADLALHPLLHERLGVAGARRERGVDGLLRDRLQVEAHASVPPTVSAAIRTWGCPTPAATR